MRETLKPFIEQHNDECCTQASFFFLYICLLTRLKSSRCEICCGKAFAKQSIILANI